MFCMWYIIIYTKNLYQSQLRRFHFTNNNRSYTRNNPFPLLYRVISTMNYYSDQIQINHIYISLEQLKFIGKEQIIMYPKTIKLIDSGIFLGVSLATICFQNEYPLSNVTPFIKVLFLLCSIVLISSAFIIPVHIRSMGLSYMKNTKKNKQELHVFVTVLFAYIIFVLSSIRFLFNQYISFR